MSLQPITYYLIGAIILIVAAGVVLLGKLLAWRKRVRNERAVFQAREKELRNEIEHLRARFDDNGHNEKGAGPSTEVHEPASTLYTRFTEIVAGELGNSSLQIDDIGQRLNLSRVQLYRRLKSETGMTPNELLRNYRLAEAAKMLAATELTVAEVAYRVGFSSPSYFSRCFKEQFGSLPQDWRNNRLR